MNKRLFSTSNQQNGKATLAVSVQTPKASNRANWQTEPEIDRKRQVELTECLDKRGNPEKDMYPFKQVKLSRADIEWLLKTHTSKEFPGPVYLSDLDEGHWDRQGLDLRGAILQGEEVDGKLQPINLKGLPLARLQGGLPVEERSTAPEERCIKARIRMEGAILEGADLRRANLHHAYLEHAEFGGARLEEADLSDATAEYANFYETNMKNANLEGIQLTNGSLANADLQGANLHKARLEKADLFKAKLENANLTRAVLERADVSGVILSSKKRVGPLLVDVQWGDTNLATANWSEGLLLGDEQKAKLEGHSIDRFEEAIRAYRLLAIALRTQGLDEEATNVDYRAQVLKRRTLRMRRNYGKWLFSLLLDIIAGYGYRMWRILGTYIVIVSLFAIAYFLLGVYYGQSMSLLDAFLTSITAFHGRVFLDPFSHKNEPQLWVAAFEAIAGLLIEGVVIAILTRRCLESKCGKQISMSDVGTDLSLSSPQSLPQHSPKKALPTSNSININADYAHLYETCSSLETVVQLYAYLQRTSAISFGSYSKSIRSCCF